MRNWGQRKRKTPARLWCEQRQPEGLLPFPCPCARQAPGSFGPYRSPLPLLLRHLAPPQTQTQKARVQVEAAVVVVGEEGA